MITHLRRLRAAADAAAPWAMLAGATCVAAWNLRLLLRARVPQPSAAPALQRRPSVSVLVAAWNEAASIEAHLRSFLALRYPQIELILCAGGDDATLMLARHLASDRVTVIEQRRGDGKQRSLARCLEHASGEVVVLTDADCMYDDEALERLLAPIVNEGERITTGASRPLDSQMCQVLPRYLWASDVVASSQAPAYADGILGRNAAITRAALDQAGGLGFEARTGTDYQLAKRLLASGAAIRAVPESVVPTAYPDTLASYRSRQSRWLRNLLIYGARYRAYADIARTLRTVLTGAAMLLMPLAAPLAGRLPLAAWATLLLHACLSKLRYAAFAERASGQRTPKALYPLVLPLTLLDFALWVLPIRDLLDPKRRGRW